MTTPVSATNSSVYDPTTQFSPADGSGEATATSGPPAQMPIGPGNEVTIPPVFIGGDAGTRQLVQRFDDAQPPDCSLEAKNAGVSCGKAGLTAVTGALAATTVLGALPMAALTVLESISCGKDLRAYYDCENP